MRFWQRTAPCGGPFVLRTWLLINIKCELKPVRPNAETKATRTGSVCGRFTRVVQLERAKGKLAEQAATDPPVGHQAHQWRQGALDFDPDTVARVTQRGPALGHPDPV